MKAGLQEIPCPNDAALIPIVAEVQEGSEVVRFSWCRYCCELVAFVGTTNRLAIRFGRRDEGWHIFRAIGSATDNRLALSAVTKVAVSVVER